MDIKVFEGMYNLARYYTDKFDNEGKKADGTIARKHLMTLSKECSQMRKTILEAQKASGSKLPDETPELVRESVQQEHPVLNVEQEPEEQEPIQRDVDVEPIVVRKRAPKRRVKKT